ncbi:MAG: hypothetical protein WBM09_11795 [Gallionella sp.]
MAKFTQATRALWIVAAIAGLAGCGESEQAKPVANPVPPPPVPHTVGGTVSGLPGSGLVLQLNGANDLPVSADGKFSFPRTLAKGSSYSVSVKASPSSPVKQTCKVDRGSGKIANANINNIMVTCTTVTFAVGGTVAGLSGKGPGNQLVLQLNGANDLTIASNGKFIFPGIRLPDGSDYSVSIKKSPARQKCTIKPVSAAFDNDTLNIASVNCSKKGRRK